MSLFDVIEVDFVLYGPRWLYTFELKRSPHIGMYFSSHGSRPFHLDYYTIEPWEYEQAKTVTIVYQNRKRYVCIAYKAPLPPHLKNIFSYKMRVFDTLEPANGKFCFHEQLRLRVYLEILLRFRHFG
jgi:hypothetical protein